MDPYFQYFSSSLLYQYQLDLPEHLEVDHIIFSEYHSHISYSQLSIPNFIIYYDVTERSRFSYPRVTANLFDLTLQGRSNQHDTCKPRRATRINCFHRYHDIWIAPAKTQVLGPSLRTPREPGGDIQFNTRHHTTPRVASRDSKYCCKSGLQLTGFDCLLLPACC